MHSRPGSRAGGITATITSAAASHSHSTSISSFTDLSTSSTNIHSSHARRVRSVRKLRQILGPDDENAGNIERTRPSITTDKDLPLPPPPLSSPLPVLPPDNESTTSLSTPLSDIPSEDETGEKSISLVYARRVKLDKLKRRFGEDVPKELIFFDQASPSSPSIYRGRSLSSPNVMTFADSESYSRAHTKNASISTTGSGNSATTALKRSKAMLKLWRPKSRNDDSKLREAGIDGNETDDRKAYNNVKGAGILNAGDEALYPIQLTSLAGTGWNFSTVSEKGWDKSFSDDDAVMDSQFNIEKNPLESVRGVQVVRSRSTLIVDRTSEDDGRTHVSASVLSPRKSLFVTISESPIDTEHLLNFSHSLLKPSHDDSHENLPSKSDPLRVLRKTQSAIALASESRNQVTTIDAPLPPLPYLSSPQSMRKQTYEPSTPSTPSPTLHSPHRRRHGKDTSWSDENLDDRVTGRSVRRASKPRGPRPRSRSRSQPRTADGSIRFHDSEEAFEQWHQLEQKLASDRASSEESSSLSKSHSVSSRDSLPPPPPIKSPNYPKFIISDPQEASTAAVLSSSQKTSTKPMAAVVYFYHRGVVRLAVEDGARGPKTVQTVHMRDVLNYLREMRYVH